MRSLYTILLVLLLGGCSSLGYYSLENEVEKSHAQDEAAIRLKNQLKLHYQHGEELYQDGKLEMAEVEFQAMLVLKPEEENALYRLGTICFKQGKYDASADYFERVIKSDPRHGKAHYNLASIRLMQAQDHYKYFAALAGKDQDLSRVSDLLGDIDKFNSDGSKTNTTSSLDKIAGALKK